MRKSTKAVLLSMLLFPGTGHLYLKKYFSAAVLLSTATAAIYYLLKNTMENALEIAEKIHSTDTVLDVEMMSEMLSKQAANTADPLLSLSMIALLLCWLFGMFDSYRAGRIADEKDR